MPRKKKTKKKKLVMPLRKYDESWLDIVSALEETKAQIAARLGVTKKTLMLTAKRVPEFAEALELSQTKFEARMIAKGIRGVNDRTFQTALYQILMRNCFHWRSNDGIDHKHSGKIEHAGVVKVEFASEAKNL